MGFYQTNNKILTRSIKGAETIDFNKYPNLLDILFNHWISQKENYNRLIENFERGEFELSRSIVMDEFGIKESKAKGLIKRFVKDEIIELKERGNNQNKRSIYMYLSALESDEIHEVKKTKRTTNRDTKQRPSETLENQYIESYERPSKDQVKDQVNNHSKKELIKRINKKEINSASSEALWKLYPNKKNKSRAMKDIPRLIKKYGYEQMEQCVYRYMKYVEDERKNGFKDLKYQVGSTFFNGTYVDYLNENYQEQPNEQQSKTVNGKKYDEYGFEIITCD